MVKKAADLYMEAELPLGDGTQGPADFVKYQSATTGLPEHMCRANMQKNHFVLTRMDEVLDALTRGLDLRILAEGRGVEARGVPLSYQAQTPVLGLVLPSNSPGVHTLWLPVIPLQIGLVFKPGPQEPWTPYRMSEAFFQAGVPREAISIYPGLGDIGAAVLASCPRSLIFGGSADGREVSPRSEGAAARSRLQQDSPRRRRGRRLGEVSRHDGGERLRQQRPELYQLLRYLGVAPHRSDRRGSRREARAGGTAATGRSQERARRLYRARCRRRHLERDRPAPEGGGRRRSDRRSTAAIPERAW